MTMTNTAGLVTLYQYGVTMAAASKRVGLNTIDIVYIVGRELNADQFSALLLGWTDGREGCDVFTS